MRFSSLNPQMVANLDRGLEINHLTFDCPIRPGVRISVDVRVNQGHAVTAGIWGLTLPDGAMDFEHATVEPMIESTHQHAGEPCAFRMRIRDGEATPSLS